MGLAVASRVKQTLYAVVSCRLSWFSWPWHSLVLPNREPVGPRNRLLWPAPRLHWLQLIIRLPLPSAFHKEEVHVAEGFPQGCVHPAAHLPVGRAGEGI